MVFSRHSTPEVGRAFHADVKGRLARYGRRPEEPKVMPGVTCVLGDTGAEARDRAAPISRQRISPRDALLALERVWGRDPSGYDPDGPLPAVDPDPESTPVRGRVPPLRERGVFRTEYTGTTLRSHLGLPSPVWKGGTP